MCCNQAGNKTNLPTVGLIGYLVSNIRAGSFFTNSKLPTPGSIKISEDLFKLFISGIS